MRDSQRILPESVVRRPADRPQLSSGARVRSLRPPVVEYRRVTFAVSCVQGVRVFIRMYVCAHARWRCRDRYISSSWSSRSQRRDIIVIIISRSEQKTVRRIDYDSTVVVVVEDLETVYSHTRARE